MSFVEPRGLLVQVGCYPDIMATLLSTADGTVKRFNVSLFQAGLQNDAPEELLRDLLAAHGDADAVVPIEYGDYKYVLRVTRSGPNVYRGEFKKYGKDDLPHAGTLEGEERELELAQEEMTIDRNYFLFFKQAKLLVWQENRRASTVQVLGRYLSSTLNHTVAFNPVMTPEATRAFMLERHRTKSIEFSVARPLNPAMYNGAGDGDRILQLLAGMGGMTGTFKISANAPGIRGRVLDAARALGLGNQLIDSGNARRVKVSLEGVEHPIDLIADRLRMPISVEMNGRYPVPASIYAELQRVRDAFEEDLAAIFCR